jgi:Methyltransferase domain
MTLVPAEAMFNFPFVRATAALTVEDRLIRQGNRVSPLGTPQRWINRIDGQIISQYARLVPVGRVVVRTRNVDMLIWFSACLETPVAATLDPRARAFLTAAEIEISGNFSFAPSEAPNAEAILSDRADIVEFVNVICDEILSGHHSYLFIYDTIDVASRQLIEAAQTDGIRVELIPGPRSFAVFDLDRAEAKSAITRLLRGYIESIEKAPAHLNSLLSDETGPQLLITAFADLLDRTWTASALQSRRMKIDEVRPTTPRPGISFGEEALALADGVCALLDPNTHRLASLVPRNWRVNASRVRDELLRAGDADIDAACHSLLRGYTLLWQFFHLVESWRYHSLSENETFALALKRSAQCVIGPKAFKPFREYEFFYRFQEFELEKWSIDAPTFTFSRSSLAGNIDHFVRQSQLFGLIEMLFMLIGKERPGETIRWLDLGCSRGVTANGIRLQEYLPDRNWEIVGVDWNESAVRIANKRADVGRTFLKGDAKEAIAQLGGTRFNIISAFEVIEHLEDPVKTLKDYVPWCSDFFIAGSPLAELQGWLPAPNHIWTFDRPGFEETFRAAGLTPVFANEAYVGRFNKGADWVTLIAGMQRRLPDVVKN